MIPYGGRFLHRKIFIESFKKCFNQLARQNNTYVEASSSSVDSRLFKLWSLCRFRPQREVKFFFTEEHIEENPTKSPAQK